MKPPYSGLMPSSEPREPTLEALQRLVQAAQALLGEDFDEAWATHLRGRASPRTPPKDRHRLMDLVQDTLDSIELQKETEPGVSISVVELNHAIELAARWKDDPIWPEVLQSLKGPEYVHSIVLLAAADYLSKAGNPVDLQPSSGEGRTPDLIIQRVQPVSVEVKAPKALRGPRQSVTRAEAEQVVRAAMKSAGGQLSGGRPAMLFVGGFLLGEDDLTLLEAGANAYLRSEGKRRSHVMAILLASLGVYMEGGEISERGVRGTAETRLHSVITVKAALNPHYVGAVATSTEESPELAQARVHPPTVELPLPPIRSTEQR
jgi:hypothetical protein